MSTRDRIQKAVAGLEDHLTRPLDLDRVVDAAAMSRPSFYRVFFYLVGDSVYAYLRKRRLYEAARKLRSTDRRILDIALDHQYESHEAFGRAFKKLFGVTPSEARQSDTPLTPYRRIDLMRSECGEHDVAPEAKGIEDVPAMIVASCHVVGASPEVRSRNTLLAWAKDRGMDWQIGACRHLGFDNPDTCDPASRGLEHGYECWMTVSEDAVGNESIAIKHFEGGLYATMETTVLEVRGAWKRLAAWLDTSRYAYGDHRWLEEVLAFEATREEDTRLKLLMPIQRR